MLCRTCDDEDLDVGRGQHGHPVTVVQGEGPASSAGLRAIGICNGESLQPLSGSVTFEWAKRPPTVPFE